MQDRSPDRLIVRGFVGEIVELKYSVAEGLELGSESGELNGIKPHEEISESGEFRSNSVQKDPLMSLDSIIMHRFRLYHKG